MKNDSTKRSSAFRQQAGSTGCLTPVIQALSSQALAEK